ncbi:MAG TPA: tetratricopeptide repeat protein [Arenimonas sp.]|uniref:tetratricopeptide repeat protein n=1 Tax=Arenimonas sp. TaxID=1872635 RepID=UPI002C70EC84|nr:tetratricopeptide repeat protein [Arenimonas sp.]HMB56171.1 tetratricopeptide repeat protein [Arenimonas sp.]
MSSSNGKGMRMSTTVKWLCGFALAVTTMNACAGEKVAAAPADVQDATPAALWRDYLATADSAAVVKAYEVVFAVQGKGGVDVEKCRTHHQEFEDGLKVVPVGAGLWYNAYLCAKAEGDEARSDRYFKHFSALAAYAFAQASDDPQAPPIRVTHMVDVESLVAASGMNQLYSWYGTDDRGPYLPITVALWDAEAKTERHFRFDMLDTFIKIGRKIPHRELPSARYYLMKSYLDQQAADKAIIGVDMIAMRAAAAEESPQKQIEILRAAAKQGGINSLHLWLQVCVLSPFPECGDGLIDNLLPMAEARDALPMVYLAFAYSEGVGVKRDMDAAMALLDGADKQWSKGQATAEFARTYLQYHELPFPASLQERLLRAKAAGNPVPDRLWLGAKIHAKDYPALTADELKTLQDQAARGAVSAMAMLADYYQFQDNDKPAILLWTKKAADAGSPVAEQDYGLMLIDGDVVAKDAVLGEQWLQRAGNGGLRYSMRYVAFLRERANDWPGAEQWLLSGALYEDEDSLLELATLYLSKHPGISSGPERGVEIYRDMAKYGSHKARRGLALLLVAGEHVDKDGAQAKSLLLKDAEAGDDDSQLQLGRGYLNGDFGAVDEGEGLRWLNKAIAAGNQNAADSLAFWHYYKDTKPDAHAQAAALWRGAVAKKNQNAYNNFAWVSCTSPDPAVFDAKEGLRIVELLGDVDKLVPGAADTVASCYAAAGQFERAAKLQQQIIDRAAKADAKDSSLPGFRERLALYAAGKRYVETPAAKP